MNKKQLSIAVLLLTGLVGSSLVFGQNSGTRCSGFLCWLLGNQRSSNIKTGLGGSSNGNSPYDVKRGVFELSERVAKCNPLCEECSKEGRTKNQKIMVMGYQSVLRLCTFRNVKPWRTVTVQTVGQR